MLWTFLIKNFFFDLLNFFGSNPGGLGPSPIIEAYLTGYSKWQELCNQYVMLEWINEGNCFKGALRRKIKYLYLTYQNPSTIRIYSFFSYPLTVVLETKLLYTLSGVSNFACQKWILTIRTEIYNKKYIFALVQLSLIFQTLVVKIEF